MAALISIQLHELTVVVCAVWYLMCFEPRMILYLAL